MHERKLWCLSARPILKTRSQSNAKPKVEEISRQELLRDFIGGLNSGFHLEEGRLRVA
jgi:hypothetical protein